MDTMEIAKKLVDLCRQGKNDDAVATLYFDPGRQRRGIRAARSSAGGKGC
jgi:hypothetical protein